MKITCVADHIDGVIREVTFEGLALAEKLKEKHGGDISIILLGTNLEVFSETLKKHDLSKVIFIEGQELELYDQQSYSTSIAKCLESEMPDVLIMPQSSVGMDLAPSVAIALGLPIITSCELVDFENGKWTATRTIYNGKAKEEVSTTSSSVVVTVRPGDVPRGAEKPSSPEFVKFSPQASADSSGIKALKIERPVQGDVDITKYDVIVGIGRGLGSIENLDIAKELAAKLDGVIGCSRPVVDLGWCPKSSQVGTSGKTVTPKLYIALGISGATNHVNGMKRSGTIIAINKDPSAPIFELSHYGIVADLNEALPALIEELKKD